MGLRLIDAPSLGRRLSCLMAFPSSAQPETHEAGLELFYRLGGNCLHLHGEGGETHSRTATGKWLRTRRLRDEFFLCSQICHDGWDEAGRRSIDRFTPEAAREDVDADLGWLETDSLDLVYLDDRSGAELEPMIESMAREIARGRVRSLGVRNWTAARIQEANRLASRLGMPPIAALVTTELSLPSAKRPLWPEYVPFDATLEAEARRSGIMVFAHAEDGNLGQCVFDEPVDSLVARPRWTQRWDHPGNPALAREAQRMADARGVTPRAINLAWLLNRPFPVVAVAGLPTLLGDSAGDYEIAAALRFEPEETRRLEALKPGRTARDHD